MWTLDYQVTYLEEAVPVASICERNRYAEYSVATGIFASERKTEVYSESIDIWKGWSVVLICRQRAPGEVHCALTGNSKPRVME